MFYKPLKRFSVAFRIFIAHGLNPWAILMIWCFINGFIHFSFMLFQWFLSPHSSTRKVDKPIGLFGFQF